MTKTEQFKKVYTALLHDYKIMDDIYLATNKSFEMLDLFKAQDVLVETLDLTNNQLFDFYGCLFKKIDVDTALSIIYQ